MLVDAGTHSVSAGWLQQHLMHAAKPGQDTARVVLLWVVSRRGWLGAVPHCRLPCKNLGFSFFFLFFPLQFLFIFKVMPPRREG